jgi:hypothetical protein
MKHKTLLTAVGAVIAALVVVSLVVIIFSADRFACGVSRGAGSKDGGASGAEPDGGLVEIHWRTRGSAAEEAGAAKPLPAGGAGLNTAGNGNDMTD